MFKFIRYFFYLSYNWNLSIARKLIIQELKGEKKYGIDTTGADELRSLEKKGIDISHATIYMPVAYGLLEEVFEFLLGPASIPNIQHSTFTHFLDFGCGKGRALCMAAHYGCRKVTGIDLSKELCENAKQNLELTKKKYQELEYSVINNDAFYFEIPTGVDGIFLFNPFDELIMSAVVNNILKYAGRNKGKITVIYVNPLHKELFIKAGFKQSYYTKKMKYLEVAVLECPIPSSPHSG